MEKSSRLIKSLRAIATAWGHESHPDGPGPSHPVDAADHHDRDHCRACFAERALEAHGANPTMTPRSVVNALFKTTRQHTAPFGNLPSLLADLVLVWCEAGTAVASWASAKGPDNE